MIQKNKQAEKQQIILIKGDISGIQKFIFNVKSEKAARALKSRSEFIEKKETEFSAQIEQVVNKLDCSKKKILGGGGFYFILERGKKNNIATLKEELNSLQKSINESLATEEFKLRISCAIGDEFNNTWQALNRENNRKRYNLFDNIDEKGFQNLFRPFNHNMEEHNYNSQELKGIPKWSDELIDITAKYNKEYYIKDIYSNTIVDFDGMANFAKIRTGTSLLGALKMDIDNLGRLFNNCASVSDFETKSKIIHDFFSISLHKLLQEEFYTSEKYKWTFKENIYTVYSGGDDCFFIGAWDAIVQFAHSIKERFDSEINKSKDLKLTLSAGVVLFSPSTPVVKIGKMAEDSLSNAKRRIVNGKIEKNGINLMQEVFSWTDYEGIVQQKKMLTSLIQNDFIQRSLLEKIKRSSRGFEGLQNKIKRNKSLPIASVYRLKYYLSDVNVEQRNDIINEIFEPYSNALLEAMKIKSTNNITNDFTNPMRFPAAARLAEFSTRILKIKTNEKN